MEENPKKNNSVGSASNAVQQEDSLNVFVLNYLKGIGATLAAQELEKFTKCYFDLDYFESTAREGDWPSLYRYTSAFVKWEDEDYNLLYRIYHQRLSELLMNNKEEELNSLIQAELPNLNIQKEKKEEILTSFKKFVDDSEFRDKIKADWKEGQERDLFIEETKKMITDLYAERTYLPSIQEIDCELNYFAETISFKIRPSRGKKPAAPKSEKKRGRKRRTSIEPEVDMMEDFAIISEVSGNHHNNQINHHPSNNNSSKRKKNTPLKLQQLEDETSDEDKASKIRRNMIKKNHIIFPLISRVAPTKAEAKSTRELFNSLDGEFKDIWIAVSGQGEADDSIEYGRFASFLSKRRHLINNYMRDKYNVWWMPTDKDGHEEEDATPPASESEEEEKEEVPKDKTPDKPEAKKRGRKKRTSMVGSIQSGKRSEDLLPIVGKYAHDITTGKTYEELWQIQEIRDKWYEACKADPTYTVLDDEFPEFRKWGRICKFLKRFGETGKSGWIVWYPGEREAAKDNAMDAKDFFSGDLYELSDYEGEEEFTPTKREETPPKKKMKGNPKWRSPAYLKLKKDRVLRILPLICQVAPTVETAMTISDLWTCMDGKIRDTWISLEDRAVADDKTELDRFKKWVYACKYVSNVKNPLRYFVLSDWESFLPKEEIEPQQDK